MCRLTPWIITLICGCVAVTGNSFASDRNNLKAMLATDAPRAWSQVVEVSLGLSAKIDDQITPAHGPPSRQEVEIKTSGERWLLTLQNFETGTSPSTRRVSCSNPVYQFRLNQAAPGSGWTVDLVGVESSPSAVEAVRYYTRLQLYLGSAYLPILFKDKSFRVIDASWLERGDARLVSVEFECEAPLHTGEREVPRKGGFLLNPARCWAIEEFDIHVLDADKQLRRCTGKYEFIPQAAETPILQRAVLTKYFDGTPGRSEYEYIEYKPGPIPESEFTLSAFGLPDINAPAKPAFARAVVLSIFGAGILCLIGAALLRRRWRRAASRALP